MELSKTLNGASQYGVTSAIREQVAAAAKKPLERLSQQAESTRVQLSAVGQVKSATAQVEAAAKKLQDGKNVGSAADAAKAAQGFADAFNAQLKAGKETSGAGSARAANEVKRAVEGPGGADRAALQQAGITFAKDGSAKVDAKALEKAYQANPEQVKQTLGRLGTAAADTSSKQLSSNGTVGGTINRLTEKLGNIEQKQADFQARLEQSQKTVQEEDRRANEAQQRAAQHAFAFSGVGAYSRIAAT